MSSLRAAAANVSGGFVFTGMQDFDSLVELSRSRNGSVCVCDEQLAESAPAIQN